MQDCWIRHTQEEKGTVKPAKVSKWALLQPCFWHRWKSQISGEKICLFSDHPDQFDPITNYHHSGVAVGGAHIGWAFPGLTVCVFPSFPGKKKMKVVQPIIRYLPPFPVAPIFFPFSSSKRPFTTQTKTGNKHQKGYGKHSEQLTYTAKW